MGTAETSGARASNVSWKAISIILRTQSLKDEQKVPRLVKIKLYSPLCGVKYFKDLNTIDL